MMRKISYSLILLSVLGALSSVFIYEKHWLKGIGLPLDDSYIHLQFAKNMLKGKWFVYSIGQKPTTGDTSPLWVILIAFFGLFYKNLKAVSLMLGATFYFFTGICAYLLAQKFLKNNWLPLSCALVVIFTARILWGAVSGMEITLFSFLTLLGVLSYVRDKKCGRMSFITGAIFGLASNARPEGHLLFIFALFDWIALNRIIREKILRLSFIPWSAGLAYFLLTSPYLIFSLITTGHLTPNTFRANKLPLDWSINTFYLKLALGFFYREHFLLHLALPFSAILFLAKRVLRSERERDYFLIWLFPVGYLLVSFFVAPFRQHFIRYMIPLLPFYTLMSFYGFDQLIEILEKRIGKNFSRIFSQATSIIMALFAIYAIRQWPIITSLCVKNINEMQVKIGYWVKENTPENALIAANDIGAIFYISDRPVLDVVGLVNPELLEKKAELKNLHIDPEEILFQHLLLKKPDYLIIFPDWYPELSKKARYFRKVYSVALEDNLICGGNEMVVYKCFWEKK